MTRETDLAHKVAFLCRSIAFIADLTVKDVTNKRDQRMIKKNRDALFRIAEELETLKP